MPGFNGTGPQGKGSQTGAGLGKCKLNANKENTEKSIEGFSNEDETGKGMRMGRRFHSGKGKGNGRGLGRGNSTPN